MLLSRTDNGITNASASGAIPIDADGSAATFAQIASLGNFLTNNETLPTVFSNTVATDATHQLIASNLTTSRVLLSRTDNGITNASASGAVSINADGTATTFAQVVALGPFLTNNETVATVFSNTVAVDAAHQFIASNLTTGRVLMGRTDSGITNVSASGAVPVDADGTATTFAQIAGLGNFLTNNETIATVFSNTVATDAAHQLIASNLTTGRVLVGRGDSGITNSAASGAVPIDADGSATTFAQVQALANGVIVTNGGVTAYTYSNNFRVDAAHAFYPSNATPSRVAMIGAENALTNAGMASAANPINADGSATTAAQLVALLPNTAIGRSVQGNLTSPGFNTTKRFMGIWGFNASLLATTEANVQQVVPFAATFRNLYVNFVPNLGSGTNVIVTIRKNAADTAVTFSLNGTGAAVIGSDTTHSASFAAADLITISFLGNNPSAFNQNACISVEMDAQ